MNIKIFNKWDTNIPVQDPGLQRYINLNPIIVPRTGGRNIKISFHKNKTSIVERLISKLGNPGHKGKKHKLTSYHCTGKATKHYRMIKQTFELIEQKTKANPLAILVKAIENASPREEITTIEYGGARYPQAVECSPQRRIDISMRQMVQGAYSKAFNSKKTMIEALADEIIKASNDDPISQAISKKLELERQAASSR